MKLNRLLCLAVIALAASVQAQDLKIHVNKKGKIGYADQSGNEVIKCQYETAQPFSDGMAIVGKGGKVGIIDQRGKVLLPLKYSQIFAWNDELYLVKDGKKVGLANHGGKLVLPVKYSHVSKPNCHGRALIALGGKSTSNENKTYMANAKYGIIDAHGNVLIEPKYKGLYEFSYNGKNTFPYYEGMRLEYSYHNTVDTLKTDCGYMGFSNNGLNIYKAGILDQNGKILLKTGLYDFVMLPQSNMTRYYIKKKKQTLCGYHNLLTGKGFQVLKADDAIDNLGYWTHGDFIGDIAPVNGESWTFIDKWGKTLRSGYTKLRHSLTTGLWGAKKSDGLWDVFDDAGNDISTLSGYEDIYFPAQEGDKEIFTVKKNGRFGCVSRKGDVVVPLEYEQALGNSYDFVCVRKAGKWGAVTADNVSVIPTDYENLTLPAERGAKHFWVQKADSLYYHYNLNTKKVAGQGYKTVYNFENDYAYVVPSGMSVYDTPLNRAQIYAPNTPKATIDKVNFSDFTNAFVNIINVNDDMVFDLPVSTLYKDKVREAVKKHGNSPLTATEKKNILLDVTRENRSYDLKQTIGEEEWNY